MTTVHARGINPESFSHPLVLLGYSTLVGSFVFIAFGILNYAITAKWLSRTSVARGVVTEIKAYKKHPRSDETEYVPVIAYTSSEGEECILEPFDGDSEPKYRVGQAVDVRYMSTYPTDSRINTPLVPRQRD